MRMPRCQNCGYRLDTFEHFCSSACEREYAEGGPSSECPKCGGQVEKTDTMARCTACEWTEHAGG